MSRIQFWIPTAENLIDDFQDLINTLPYKGDKCEDSQRICVQQALNDLSATINGLEPNDFLEDDE